jgi:nucleotide-binding universal stress UspA family protein
VKTILVAVDFSDVTTDIIKAVKMFAKAIKSRVVLLHVRSGDSLVTNIAAEQIPMTPSSFGVEGIIVHGETSPRVQNQLDELKLRFAGLPFEVATRQKIDGLPAELILQTCEEEEADLIIIGSHGHGAVYNLLVGSVTAGVLKSVKCPVLLVPSPRPR